MHSITVRTEVLDQIAKSLMLSRTANVKRKRRLNGTSRAFREVAAEGDLIKEALDTVEAAQEQSWAGE